MAYTIIISLVLLLLVFDVQSVDDKCPKQCTCGQKKGKLKVDCRGNGLTEVFHSSEFPTNMLILDLSRNNITVLRRQFLDRHGQLEKLSLHKNAIRVIEERAFVGLSKLNRLVLKQNNLIKLKKQAFIGLPQLEYLDLSQNKIKYIDKDAFNGLNKLTKIVLNNNSIKAIENGTFSPLKSLRKIVLRHVMLSCDCKLNSFIQFLTVTQPPVKIDGNCYHRKTRFSSLKGANLCDAPPELIISPYTDQVVAIGDSLSITCKTIKQPVLHLGWTKNGKAIRKNDLNVMVRTITTKTEMAIGLHVKFLTKKNAGVYECSDDQDGVVPKSVRIHIVSPSERRCGPELIKSDRGQLLWPVTIAGTTPKLPCPSLGDQDSGNTAVRRTCSQDGAWSDVIYGKCKWVPLYKRLVKLESLTADTDVADITSKLKMLTEPSNIHKPRDISLVLNVVASVIRKQGDALFFPEVLDDLLATFNNIMDVDQQVLYDAEKADQSPSRLAAHLEYLSRKSAIQRLSRVFSNIVLGSVDLQKKNFKGKNCRVFFQDRKASRADGVQCQPQKRKDYVVSIHIPKPIFQNLRASGIDKEDLAIQILVYRNAKLFPNIITNKTSDFVKERDVSSSVLSIQLAQIKELNLTEPITLSFGTKAGTDAVISHFDFREKVVGRSWSANHDCRVNRSTVSMTTVSCRRLVNKNLAVMSIFGSGTILVYSIEIVVYVGAVIASLLLLATLVTFTVFRGLRFNHDDVLILMNACFSLLIIVTTFAFGINRTNNNLACIVVGVLIHFFFLASLLWLGSYVVCVSRSLRKKKESEEEFNPVLRYYMVSWGVPAIICGITLAGDLKNYNTDEYCWLTDTAGLGAFVTPAWLLLIINCVLLVRLYLLLARGGTSRRASEENSEEERLQNEEPAVLEITPDPGNQSTAEKYSMTLCLVATCVVMSLVYVNSIVAYLLLKFRHVYISWKLLSYVYALANIALGASVFLFHCVARRDVRESWQNAWKRVKAIRVDWGHCGPIGVIRQRMLKYKLGQVNGRIFVNGEEVKDSDRQSNITLPSSAALTNDIFVDGRPVSTARISLLDEADFPAPENEGDACAVNEVDITVSEDGVHLRSEGSVYSDKKSVTHSPIVPKPTCESPLLSEETISGLFPTDNDEVQADVTSKSESSAPTAIEVPQTSTPNQDAAPSPPRPPPRPVVPVESEGSRSSSSLGETPTRAPIFKRKRSSESLNSRASSARKVPVYNGYPSNSTPFAELAVKNLEPKRPRIGEPVNTRVPVPLTGPNGAAQVPKNRYKDGREKPEPKPWMANGAAKFTYVPVPHVSKIHRQPTRNETSV